MARRVRMALLVAFVAAVGACGGDSGGAALSQTDVRQTLSKLLAASVRDDLVTAAPHLAVREFMGVNASAASKPFEKLTPEERDSYSRACFNQLKAATEGASLREASAIDAALAAGTIQVHEKIRRADVVFQGTSSDGRNRPVGLQANLVLYNDGGWRLISVEERLGR